MGDFEFLTLKEASVISKMSPGTLRKYIKARKLRGAKAGRGWIVTEDALREFFLRGGRDAAPLAPIAPALIAAPETTADQIIDTAPEPIKVEPLKDPIKSAVASWIEKNKSVFAAAANDYTEETLGFFEKKKLLVPINLFNEMLKEEGFDPREARRHLGECGVIWVTKENNGKSTRYTVQRVVCGKKPSFVVISPEKLDEIYSVDAVSLEDD